MEKCGNIRITLRIFWFWILILFYVVGSYPGHELCKDQTVHPEWPGVHFPEGIWPGVSFPEVMWPGVKFKDDEDDDVCPCKHTCENLTDCCFENDCCLIESRSNVSFILEGIPRSLDTLNITKSLDGVLTSEFLSGHCIRHIILDGNELDDIETGAFAEVCGLFRLHLRWNNITQLRPDMFIGSMNLSALLLDGNNIELDSPSLVSDTLVLPNLRYLSLARNPSIQRLVQWSFAWIASNRFCCLNLERCNIKEIHPDSLLPLKDYLTHLDVSNNWNIEPALDNLTISLEGGVIEELGLARIGLQNVPIQQLSRLKSLTGLSLEGNSLSTIRNEDSFPDLPHLTIINLNNCDLVYIGEHVFEKLTNLSALLLSENRLTQVPGAVRFISTLAYLDLSHNPDPRSLNKWSPTFLLEPLCELQSLKYLDLSHTVLGKLESDSLTNVPYLKALNLSNAYIREMEPFAFRNLTLLRYLDISYNDIHQAYFSDGVFANLTNLQLLNAESCNLTFLNFTSTDDKTDEHFSAFQDLKSLKYLNLRSNELKRLPPDFLTFLPSLEIMDLNDNSVIEWYDSLCTNVTNSTLKMLMLRNNRISSVTPVMVGDLVALNVTKIDLSVNKILCCEEFDKLVELLNGKFVNLETTGCYCKIDEQNYEFLSAQGNKSCGRSLVNDDTSSSTATVIVACLGLLVVFVIAGFLSYHRVHHGLSTGKNLNKKQSNKKEKVSYEYDVFVSYCENDRQWVLDHLLPNLESDSRIKVCLHERDFQVGRSVVENIVDCIEKSRAFLLVVSKTFISSRWCHFEVHFANIRAEEAKLDKIILVFLEHIPYGYRPKTLQRLMKSRTYIEWTSDVHEQLIFWKRVKQAILKVNYETEFYNFIKEETLTT